MRRRITVLAVMTAALVAMWAQPAFAILRLGH